MPCHHSNHAFTLYLFFIRRSRSMSRHNLGTGANLGTFSLSLIFTFLGAIASILAYRLVYIYQGVALNYLLFLGYVPIVTGEVLMCVICAILYSNVKGNPVAGFEMKRKVSF